MAAVISGGVRKVGVVAPGRIVRACNRSTGELVEETVSDQIGNYVFENLDTSITYYVYALDLDFNQYNAAIGDVLKPLPLFSFTGSAIGTVASTTTSSGTFTFTNTSSVGIITPYGVSTATFNTTDILRGGPIPGAISSATFAFFSDHIAYSDSSIEAVFISTATIDITATTNITIDMYTFLFDIIGNSTYTINMTGASDGAIS
jgi:hypothetical protein